MPRPRTCERDGHVGARCYDHVRADRSAQAAEELVTACGEVATSTRRLWRVGFAPLMRVLEQRVRGEFSLRCDDLEREVIAGFLAAVVPHGELQFGRTRTRR
jgi:hypothetical protein